jgi:HAD superfamily hydrolase (TIGR01509 family)
MRNEVMCTLAYGTVIIQAHEKDGSLIQADFSFKHGRDVLIYAENKHLPDSDWVSRLEQRGATLFGKFDDVLTAVAVRHDQFRNLRPPEVESPMTLFGSSGTDRALLVDVDGVLADTEPLAQQAARDALVALGVAVDDRAAQRLGRRRPAQLARDYGLDWKAFRAAYDPVLERGLMATDLIHQDVWRTLVDAKAAGWLLAAVTSQPKRRALATLKEHAAIFDTVVTYTDTPGRAKPDPFPFVLALQRLGVGPETCLAIGDTHTDILAARAAKVRSVAVLWGYEDEADLRRYNPDYIVSNTDELREAIDLPALVPSR